MQFHNKIHTHPKEGHWEFLEGGGLKIQNFQKQTMKLNWNFLEGGGVQNKKPYVGEGGMGGSMEIFWNCMHIVIFYLFLQSLIKINEMKLTILKSLLNPKYCGQ